MIFTTRWQIILTVGLMNTVVLQFRLTCTIGPNRPFDFILDDNDVDLKVFELVRSIDLDLTIRLCISPL